MRVAKKTEKTSQYPKHDIHRDGVNMFRKASLVALVVAGTLIAAAGNAVAAGVPVNGAWTCTVVRAGTIERPIIYTFGSDGTFNYSSATTINSTVAGPVQNSGFHSRGGGRGEWTKISTNVFSTRLSSSCMTPTVTRRAASRSTRPSF